MIKIYSNNKGQAIILVTVMFAVLAMFVGLAAEGGTAFLLRHRLSRTADAAALAGARALAVGGSAPATAAACDLARLNLQVEGASGTCPANTTVTFQTLTLPNGSTQSGIVVKVSQLLDTSFLRLGSLFGCGDVCTQLSIGARAAAATGAPACAWALSPNKANAFQVGPGNASMTALGCGIYVGSSSPNAVTTTGNGSIDTAWTNIVGGFSNNGSGTINPTPTTGVAAQADPWASLPTPTPSGSCQAQPGGSSKSFTPGRYCSVSMSGTDAATFAAGNYYIDNGFSMTGSSSASGSQVTFYVAAGKITITGSGAITFTAPTTGVYAGLTFFQNRSNTQEATITGGSQLSVQGIYVAGARLTYSGGSCTDVTQSLIVADTIQISGGSCVTKSSSLPPGAIGGAFLVN